MDILRIREVSAKTGLSRSSIYNLMRAGTFPKGIALTESTRGWLKSEVEGWIKGRIDVTRQQAA